ncbi:Uncharacterised protein [uncultured archaeon]|nr:Uncharacterised protein [uncultured archaeon]
MKELWYFVLMVLMLGVLACFTSMTPTGAFVANLPPKWDYPTDEFSYDESFSLDLNTAFFDPDGNPLSFSVSPSEGFTAGLYDNVLVALGEGQVTITASDGNSVVSKTIKVLKN